jgi:hypothetical protein
LAELYEYGTPASIPITISSVGSRIKGEIVDCGAPVVVIDVPPIVRVEKATFSPPNFLNACESVKDIEVAVSLKELSQFVGETANALVGSNAYKTPEYPFDASLVIEVPPGQACATRGCTTTLVLDSCIPQTLGNPSTFIDPVKAPTAGVELYGNPHSY